MTGSRRTWPKEAGEAQTLGPVHLFWVMAGLAGSEPHHSGTKSRSGKLTSSSPSPNHAAWLSLLLGSGWPQLCGGRGVSEVIPLPESD